MSMICMDLYYIVNISLFNPSWILNLSSWQDLLTTGQGGSHRIHSANITPIGLVVELGSTARSSIICHMNRLTYILSLSLSPCIKSRGIISAFSSLLEFLEPASFGSFLVLRQDIGELLAFRFDCCPFSSVDHPQSLPRWNTSNGNWKGCKE